MNLVQEIFSQSAQPVDVHYLLGKFLVLLDTSLPREFVMACLDCSNKSSLMDRAERMKAELGKRRVKWMTKKDTFFARLPLALAGGFALIAPMLIMTLHKSKLTSLLTTSFFVLAVAIMLSWFMKDASPKDIIGATAAYAAVLVVFVGTGGN